VLSDAAPPERRIADAWAGKKNGGKNMVTATGFGSCSSRNDEMMLVNG